MSQITLKPLDDGQKAVEIPLGKTTIGRGPFLGCSDKKVSRNHAVLEVTSKGEVYLTPTHVNPCFYQPTAESPGQILKKDIPHKLENGDSFSLLPRAYRYQLSVVSDAHDNKSTEENDLKKEVGKTNGSAGDGLEEAGKDTLKGECTEEQGDTIVAEKTFAKEDPPENAEKKEDNNFSEKLADLQEEQKQKSDLSKENSVPPKGSPEELPPEASPSEHSKPDESEDGVALNTSHPSISSIPEPEQKEQKPDSLVCQNETLNKPSKDSENEEASADPVAPPEEDEPVKAEDSPKEVSSVAETEDKKDPEDCEETKDDDDEIKDPASPKEDEEEEEEPETVKSSPVRTEEPTTPAKRPRGKKGAAKQTTPKKQTPKRKPASESSPKPKGRKKTKLTFDDGGEGSSQQQVAGRTSSRTNRQTRQGLSLEDFIVSDDDEWQSDRSSERPKQQQRRRRRRDSDSGSDWETEHKKVKKPVHKVGSGSESGSDWGTQRKRKGGPRGKRRKNKSTASEPGSEEEAEPSTSNAAAPAAKSDKPRIPCTYGKKCFRKHPNHLEQFSHPGDSDYDVSEAEPSQKEAAVSEEEVDETPKKECPYGANCFRKNPQHKKDFKHTKKVRPQREAAKQADKKTKSSRNSAEVDTYDLNDSLLNDDSADEYKPMDSGSDYESGEKAKRTAKGRRGRRTA